MQNTFTPESEIDHRISKETLFNCHLDRTLSEAARTTQNSVILSEVEGPAVAEGEVERPPHLLLSLLLFLISFHHSSFRPKLPTLL
jgi:hypothetical protein